MDHEEFDRVYTWVCMNLPPIWCEEELQDIGCRCVYWQKCRHAHTLLQRMKEEMCIYRPTKKPRLE